MDPKDTEIVYVVKWTNDYIEECPNCYREYIEQIFKTRELAKKYIEDKGYKCINIRDDGTDDNFYKPGHSNDYMMIEEYYVLERVYQ